MKCGDKIDDTGKTPEMPDETILRRLLELNLERGRGEEDEAHGDPSFCKGIPLGQ